MKRRLIGIALCLAMLCTAIMTASCGKEDDMSDVGEDKVASAMTLTIWGIKEKGTTDEAIAEVEAAMSRITEAQFNTAVKLMLFTESEYDKALEKKMDEIQERLDAEAAELRPRRPLKRKPEKTAARTPPPPRRLPPRSRPTRLTKPFLTNTDCLPPSIPRLRTISLISSS